MASATCLTKEVQEKLNYTPDSEVDSIDYDQLVAEMDPETQSNMSSLSPVPTSSPTRSETGDCPADMPSPEAIQDTFERYKQEKDKEEKDKYKTYLNIMCDKVSEHIAKLSDKIVSVKACVDVRKKSHKICFFVQTNEENVKIDTDHNFERRQRGEYNYEGAFINNHSKRQTKKITPEEVTQIEAIVEHEEENLFDNHSNIQMIHGCSVKSKAFDTENAKIEGKACIVIYVTAKGLIPLNEEMLPKVLQMPNNSDTGSFEVPVDVREGGMEFYSGPKEFHQNVKMGCMIKTDENDFGTLGPVLERNGKTCVLTCAHIFLEQMVASGGTYNKDNDSGVGPIWFYQNEVNTTHKMGEVADAEIAIGSPEDRRIRYGVDIAVIELTNDKRIPIDGTFPDSETTKSAGFPIGSPMFFRSGAVYSKQNYAAKPAGTEALKFGCQTEWTKGTFDEFLTYHRPYLGKIKDKEYVLNLKKQLSVRGIGGSAFSNKGDSGSIVFIMHEGQSTDLRAVGMVEGGTLNGTSTIVTPIWQIFDYLERETESGLMTFDK